MPSFKANRVMVKSQYNPKVGQKPWKYGFYDFMWFLIILIILEVFPRVQLLDLELLNYTNAQVRLMASIFELHNPRTPKIDHFWKSIFEKAPTSIAIISMKE